MILKPDYFMQLNIHTPIICTPEELMEIERYVE